MRGAKKILFMITLTSHDYIFVNKVVVQVDILKISILSSESTLKTLIATIVKR